jgi:membrane-associated protease RseP (regulator of RpoE activity)
MAFPEQDVLNSIVSRVFKIEDFTLGDPQKTFIARYRGHLYSEDSEAAYDQLAESLKPYKIIPLFRLDDGGRHVVFLISGVIDPKPSDVRVNVILFILTVLSVLLVGVDYQGPAPQSLAEYVRILFENIWTGWPFALSLLSILVAHEFGHYLMARHHRTSATLPYFLPFPLPPLGTLGAVIIWKEPPRNRKVLFDVGVTGPLAGLIVALPVLFIGLKMSHLGTVTNQPGTFLEGNSLLYLFMKYTVFGRLLPAPVSYNGLSPFLYWMRYVFTGMPFPQGGTDVFISAVALAGWAGLLVTALNLLPAGQLDGGHVMYVLFGNRLKVIFPVLIGLMVILGLFWSGWWLWVFLLFIFGRRSAEPLDQITQLNPSRRALAIFMIVIFVLVFMPVPFSGI